MIFVCVGGKGNEFAYTSSSTSTQMRSGGYNGGGQFGYCSGSYGVGGGSGGGATHIDTKTGTLAEIGVNYLSKILIVAGGGGGGMQNNSTIKSGGAGGGVSGGNGILISSSDDGRAGNAGTQTSGGSSPNTFAGAGSFGKGGDGSTSKGFIMSHDWPEDTFDIQNCFYMIVYFQAFENYYAK